MMSEPSDASEAPIEALSFLVDTTIAFQVRVAQLLGGAFREIPIPRTHPSHAIGCEDPRRASITPVGPSVANLQNHSTPSNLSYIILHRQWITNDLIFAHIRLETGRVLVLRSKAWSLYQTVHDGDNVAIKIADLEYVPSREETDPAMRLSLRGRVPWYIAMREVGGRDFLHMSCQASTPYWLHVRIRNNDTMETYDREWMVPCETGEYGPSGAYSAYSPPSMLDANWLDPRLLTGRTAQEDSCPVAGERRHFGALDVQATIDGF